MKSKKLKINLLCLLCILIFPSCAEKLNISVNVIDNEKIEITNLGTKPVSNLDIRIFSDIDKEARAYIKNISLISSNEKIILPVEELKNAKGNGYPKEQKIKSIRFANGKDTSKELYTWNYTPVFSDPSGYVFSDRTMRVRFYKYYNPGTFSVHYSSGGTWYKSDSGNFLHNGKFSYQDGKITLESGKYIWDGTLEDDELKLKIRGGRPAGAGILFSEKETLVREGGANLNIANLGESENYLNYEESLLVLLSQNYDEENLIKEYAQIYHNDEYEKSKNDEFVWHEKKEEYKKEIQEKLKTLDKELSIRLNWVLGDYDFNKEAFSVDFSQNGRPVTAELLYYYNEVENTNLNLKLLEKKYTNISHLVSIAVPARFGTYKALNFTLSMEKSKAQEFLAKRKDENGKTDKSIMCIIHYKIPTTYSKQLFASLLGQSYNVMGTFYKIEVYDNEKDMNLLYSGSVKQK